MDRLISLDELNKFPIRLDHYDKEHGDETYVLGIETVLEYAEYLPTVDAVPRTLFDDLLNHLCETCSGELYGRCARCRWNEYRNGGKERNEMKKLAMISQPMAGRSTWEIDDARNRAIAELERRGYYVVNTFFTGAWHGTEKLEGQGVVQIPLRFLAKSLEKMSFCHAVYFCRGWQDARGCRIEHDAAVTYGLEVIEE